MIFKQPRIGKGGKVFIIYKVRTMKDGKITRVGRHLRRWRLDEGLQIVNIIKGEMSIVGPRPLIIEEHKKLRGYNLPCKPGITGLWQINGCDQKVINFCDITYYQNKSWWFDFIILLKTIPAILRNR